METSNQAKVMNIVSRFVYDSNLRITVQFIRPILKSLSPYIYRIDGITPQVIVKILFSMHSDASMVFDVYINQDYFPHPC